MVMRLVLVARMVKLARRALPARFADPKRARHAEMHQQHVAGGEAGQQIFGAAAEAGDGLAVQASRKILLKGKAQVPAAGFRLDDPGALHDRLQAAPDGLDFRQFGHFGHSPWRGDVIAPLRPARYGPGPSVVPSSLRGAQRRSNPEPHARPWIASLSLAMTDEMPIQDPEKYESTGPDHAFRLPQRALGREADAGERGVSQRRLALRSDERSDVDGPAPGLEGHHDQHA